MNDLTDMLSKVAKGEMSPEKAAEAIAGSTEKNIGFARIDTDRAKRRGLPEVIYCPGKTPAQVVGIAQVLVDANQDVLATRATPEQYAAVKAQIQKAEYNETARAITVDTATRPKESGLVVVVSAGTSDLPVAEEAALVAERMGARVERVSDVGVAGLHRVVKHVNLLKSARAIVVVAGMEGALPSVVGGLVDRPIIAVPTSVGYGTGSEGIPALLSMLNTCVPGITVVNIDNGFGAGVAAAMINRTV